MKRIERVKITNPKSNIEENSVGSMNLKRLENDKVISEYFKDFDEQKDNNVISQMLR